MARKGRHYYFILNKQGGDSVVLRTEGRMHKKMANALYQALEKILSKELPGLWSVVLPFPLTKNTYYRGRTTTGIVENKVRSGEVTNFSINSIPGLVTMLP
jgi:hypothetical protein